jgi:anti-anti-sigma factor
MDIREDTLLGVPVLKISGEIDHSSASDFDCAAQAHICLGDHRLIVDLTSCRYIDSGGLAVFLHLTRQLPGRGWLAVVGADPNVSRLFQIVGLEQEPGFRKLSRLEEAAALIESAA